jgi:hypothetical protein
MNNLHAYNEFKNKKNSEILQESAAQLFTDTWKVRTRVEIPVSLINAFVKKVQNETGEDPRKKWSEQELAEEISNYVTSSFLTIENLPVSIISNATMEPKIQSQEDMSPQTQVQTDSNAQPPVQNAQEQNVPAQAPAQSQGTPAQAPAQGTPAQNVASTIPQGEQTI